MRSFRARLGQFFLLVGLACLILFYASAANHTAVFELLLAGLPLSVLGAYLVLKALPPPPAETQRFRALRRWRQKRAEKKKAQPQKKK